jgi:hypothetical protein
MLSGDFDVFKHIFLAAIQVSLDFSPACSFLGPVAKTNPGRW